MNIFLVTSTMYPYHGSLSFDERYNQTIESFDSIRRQVKDAIIIFSDSSVYPIEEERKEIIRSKVDEYINFSGDTNLTEINRLGLKSHGELYLLYMTISYLKTKYNFSELKGRMFKFGARCYLTDKFDINDYNDTNGKFVFKKRLNSWMNKDIQDKFKSTHILETRLYSWCFSLIDEYLNVLRQANNILQLGLDTEHAHFLTIDKNKLLEFDTLNCNCVIAADREVKYD